MATHIAILWSRASIYSEPESVFLLHGSHAAPLLNLWVLLLHKHNSRYEEPPLTEMHSNLTELLFSKRHTSLFIIAAAERKCHLNITIISPLPWCVFFSLLFESVLRYSADFLKSTECFLRRFWRSLLRLFFTEVLPSQAFITAAFSTVWKSGVVWALAKRQVKP